MHVVIAGAGGIGCTHAARLLFANQSVTRVARGAPRSELRSHGLRVEGPNVRSVGPLAPEGLPVAA